MKEEWTLLTWAWSALFGFDDIPAPVSLSDMNVGKIKPSPDLINMKQASVSVDTHIPKKDHL